MGTGRIKNYSEKLNNKKYLSYNSTYHAIVNFRNEFEYSISHSLNPLYRSLFKLQ